MGSVRNVTVRVHGSLASVEHDGALDEVAVEEPLEIRVDGEPRAVTMRTRAQDEGRGVGFLGGGGLLARARGGGPSTAFAANTVGVAGPLVRAPGRRRFYPPPSWGVCGKGALEEIGVAAPAA